MHFKLKASNNSFDSRVLLLIEKRLESTLLSISFPVLAKLELDSERIMSWNFWFVRDPLELSIPENKGLVLIGNTVGSFLEEKSLLWGVEAAGPNDTSTGVDGLGFKLLAKVWGVIPTARSKELALVDIEGGILLW